MSKQPPPAPSKDIKVLALLLSKVVGRPGTASLLSTIALPDYPLEENKKDIPIKTPDLAL